MFYQKILTGITPYQLTVTTVHDFREHRHADIEVLYCISGNFNVTVNKKTANVTEGQILLVSPMAAHSYQETCDNTTVLTIIVGSSFLKNFFSYFSKAKNDFYVTTLGSELDYHKKLSATLDETCILFNEKLERNQLLIRGNLCKICSYLIDCISSHEDVVNSQTKEMSKVANIEKALEMIYYDHASPLTVEDAAAATGYGKSNFCKIFKNITGDTFHNVLNRQRVESACAFLSETNLPISQIASQVGFGETKTFCRVFKSVTGQTPGEYRKTK